MATYAELLRAGKLNTARCSVRAANALMSPNIGGPMTREHCEQTIAQHVERTGCTGEHSVKPLVAR